MINVLLADDQALVRAGFRALLSSAPDITVAGEAEDGAAAVRLARDLHPDVVLMDIRMPGTDGLTAARDIVTDPRLRDVRVVMLTTFAEDAYIFDAIRAGASGFLVKDIEPADLLTAIRVVHRGEALLSPTVTRRLIEEFAARAKPPRPGPRPGPAAGAAHRPRARGPHPRRRRAVQRRDRPGPRGQPGYREDPRQPRHDQARRARPRPARRHRLRERSGPAGLDELTPARFLRPRE